MHGLVRPRGGSTVYAASFDLPLGDAKFLGAVPGEDAEVDTLLVAPIAQSYFPVHGYEPPHAALHSRFVRPGLQSVVHTRVEVPVRSVCASGIPPVMHRAL